MMLFFQSGASCGECKLPRDDLAPAKITSCLLSKTRVREGGMSQSVVVEDHGKKRLTWYSIGGDATANRQLHQQQWCDETFRLSDRVFHV